ncbi:hypothetical protein GOP47_0018839 [Adiantum capillus-veneris]|uniref:Uncharacterized protein n=1 Tax=Adiantum capillus-veneris TaxID=13818 RepID=A0A9D4UE58_ADICA|nr:hypothetical protein GOP47_0018839 [Adiantum capillus-veneris]
MSSPDLFDVYFQRADTDRDGRISGQEAVSFFQGTNLNRDVLARIWQYADQGQTGYLSRAQFYNALKLVTVAQTGRELTPAIVSRALNGPAASQIPAPQIQFTQGPVPFAPLVQAPGGGRPVQPMGSPTQAYQQYPAANSSAGSGPVLPTVLNKQGNPAAAPRPAGTPADWPTNKSSSWPGPSSNTSLNGAPAPPSITQGGSLSGSSSAIKSDFDFFGGDVFTAVPGKASVVGSQSLLSSAAPQTSQPTGTASQMSQPRGMQEMNHASTPSSTPARVLQPVSTSVGQPGRGIGPSPGIDASKTWPKMTDAIVRRYTKIFFDVDSDKDGKISGTQARDLFLSWQLPREVLKQIWDLSDQDHDSMLSLREFCVALYLMERHRERRVLPAAINAAVYFDESGIQALRISEAQVAVVQNSAGYNVPAWRQNPGTLQAPGPGLPPRPVSLGQSPVRTPIPASSRGGFVPVQMPQANWTGPGVDMKQGPQLVSNDSTVRSKHQEAAGGERKVQEFEKQFMDSKEKMEFYRTKLQDVVLFKTRCDNRLAEITDKAAADKREVESLAKRYDEKYKQAGESQSRLHADEAAFRDIQERRLELHNALVRMEQGGDLNAFLQVRADRLQNDLDELKKALNTKCKQFGLRMKPISVLEIPFGWQPGIQESAAQWDEEWDKFEEEGFECVQEFMEEGTAGSDASKPKTVASWDESGQQEDDYEPSSPKSDVHEEGASIPDKNHTVSAEDQQDKKAENGDQKDVSLSDPKQSLSGISSIKNTWDPHKFNHMPPSPKSKFDDSFSNGGEWDSVFNHTKDGTQSSASRGASHNSDVQAGKPSSGSIFGSDDPFDKLSISSHEKDDLPSFGPIRTKERPSVFFDASVPSTPLHSSYSPGPISGGSFFDDSVPSTPAYSNNASGFGSSRESLTRFDSFSSMSSDFPHPSDSFARFDSFNYASSGPTRGFTSFDEPDTLGNGAFGGQHAKHSTDTWSAFG